MADSLSMWTIYDHPKDYPDCFVARRWESIGKYSAATNSVITSPTLSELRDKFARLGLVKLDRMPEDDEKIVEVWL